MDKNTNQKTDYHLDDRNLKEIYHVLFEQASEGIFVSDKGGKYIDVNPRGCEMLGYTKEEILKLSVADLILSDKLLDEPLQLEKLWAGSSLVTERHLRRKDGSLIFVEIRGRMLPDGKLLGLVRDVSKRKQAQDTLQENEIIFSSFLEHSPVYVFFKDKEIRSIRLSKNYEQMLGMPVEDALGKTMDELFPSDLAKSMIADDQRILNNGERVDVVEELNGRTYETTKFPIFRDGKPEWLAGFTLEITERVKAEKELKHVSRLYATLSQVNQTIVRIKEPQELFQAICEVATKYGEFQMAWIGLLDPESGQVEITAIAGQGCKYLESVQINLNDEQSRNGPTARSLLTNQVIVVNEIEADESMKPWYKAVMEYGYRSLAVVPFSSNGKVVGVLDLYSTDTGFFTVDVQGLLEEIGVDISFALDTMANEAKRKEAVANMRQRLTELEMLYESGLVFSQLESPRETGQKILDLMSEKLGWKHTTIRLYHGDDQEMELLAFNKPGIKTRKERQETEAFFKSVVSRPGQGLTGWAALHGQIIRSGDVSQDERFVETAPNLNSGMYIPMKNGKHIVGVISIEDERPDAFDEVDERLAKTLAAQAAIAIDNARLFEEVQRSNLELMYAYDATIEGWSHALDLRDKETEGHTQRVTLLTLALAARLGLSGEELVQIRRGALLHDIGKLGIPDAIMFKPAELSQEETELMKKHPLFAYEMLASVEYLHQALDIPYCHHERWDGSGYPRGLKGEQIPFAARIFAVIDVWDALTSDRPYRYAWSYEKAFAYIRERSGILFDPQVVSAFLEMIADKKNQGSAFT